jgi:hypothetical protein
MMLAVLPGVGAGHEGGAARAEAGRLLRAAVRSGDLDAIRRCLVSTNRCPASSFVDSVDREERTSLMLACSGGEAGAKYFSDDSESQLKAVRMLLAAGANVGAADRKGNTAVHRVASAGLYRILVHLTPGDAAVHCRASNLAGRTPLHAAAYGGHAAVVRCLLTKGADPSAASARDGRTPLHDAALKERPAVVELLLNGGADPNARDEAGNPPLAQAQGTGPRAELVRRLLGGTAAFEPGLAAAFPPAFRKAARELKLLSVSDRGGPFGRLDKGTLDAIIRHMAFPLSSWT